MSDLFQVSLLTEGEVSDIKLNEPPKEETPKLEDGKGLPAKENLIADEPKKLKVDILTPEEVGAEIEEDEDTGIKKVIQKNEPSKEDIALDYKALAESRIKNGAWEEYENWEELKDTVEWTPELFEKLETEQFQAKVQKAIEEEKSQFGNQYKALLEHAQNGGNIQELLPSIQQEVNLESLNEDSLEDAEELIRAECEAKGWSETRIKKYVQSVLDEGEEYTKEVAKEAKSSLKSIIEEERQEIINFQKAEQKAYKDYWESFNRKIRESIFKDEELSSKEQKDLEKFVFEYKHVNEQTGQKYSDFNKKFEEIKSDPSKYAKLIKIVKNFDEVVKKDTAKKEALKETTFLLRGAQEKLSKNKTTESPEFKKSTASKGQWNPFQIKN